MLPVLLAHWTEVKPMPPPVNQAPELTFSEMRTLIQTVPVDIAKKLFYVWTTNNLVSFADYYTLFNDLKVRL